MPLSIDQLDALAQWVNVAQKLAQFKLMESQQRDKLVIALFDPTKDEGSETVEIENGWTLKATKKLDYKLANDEGQVQAIVALMDPDTAKKLFKWKPDLSISTYKQLDAQTQGLLNGFLTIKPAKASLELIPPKDK